MIVTTGTHPRKYRNTSSPAAISVVIQRFKSFWEEKILIVNYAAVHSLNKFLYMVIRTVSVLIYIYIIHVLCHLAVLTIHRSERITTILCTA